MYHSISDDLEKGRSSYFKLCTPIALFRRHLQVLKDEGFTVVDLAAAVCWLAERSRCSDHRSPAALVANRSRLAVITFDDGYQDFVDAAWPILCDFGFTATVFLPTHFIGSPRRAFKGRNCLTWQEVRELNSAGIRFGSHTINHANLAEIDQALFESEIRDSKRLIEDELGERIGIFSHPYAFPSPNSDYVRRFRNTLQRNGYSVGVTTKIGCVRPADDPLLLKRLPINASDDPDLFRAKLDGAYDWLGTPQHWLKAARHYLNC
ncbi:MAG TPA: polysaccharide deacetylase family protein [Terrimicrobiaceae bacterium]